MATLERALTGSKVVVESPKRIRDTVTGKKREHDVVLTVQAGHHTTLFAIECRDRSRAVGIEAVEAFSTKCRHTGVQGVIVSSTGFTDAALKKAKHYGIRCLDLKTAQSLRLAVSTEFEMSEVGVKHIHMVCIPRVQPLQKPEFLELLSESGVIISDAHLRNEVSKNLEPFRKYAPGEHRIAMRLLAPGFRIRDTKSGDSFEIERIDATIDILVVRRLEPIKPLVYSDQSDTKPIATAAIAAVSFEGFSGNLVMTQRPGEGTEIKLVIDSIDHAKLGSSPAVKPVTEFRNQPGPTLSSRPDSC